METLVAWAQANSFETHFLSGNWVVRLVRGELVLPIISYDIGLNPSSVHRIVNDKVATYDVLAASHVAAVEHQIVLEAALAASRGEADELGRLTSVLSAFGGDALLKPLDQSQGLDVIRVRSEAELSTAYADLSVRYPRFAISPFVKIIREDRFYFLDDTLLLSYGKRAVGLKANLAEGGEVLFHDGSEQAALDLARVARRALALRYGCIDIVTLETGALLVMEANSGVMLDEIARQAKAAGVTLPLRETYTAGLDTLLAERST
ncbi:MAG: hypothetical protein AAGO57_06900 [Pseudomonadota bacterium]